MAKESFNRITTALRMRFEDLRHAGGGGIRLREERPVRGLDRGLSRHLHRGVAAGRSIANMSTSRVGSARRQG